MVGLAVWLIIWRVKFSLLENVFGTLGLALLVFGVALWQLHPHWGDLVHQIAVPHKPKTEGTPVYFYYAIALFGAADAATAGAAHRYRQGRSATDAHRREVAADGVASLPSAEPGQIDPAAAAPTSTSVTAPTRPVVSPTSTSAVRPKRRVADRSRRD